MKKSSINWSVKQFTKMMNKGTISFDYPIQREGEQWDLYQKSLLIHSLAEDYPVPALYSIVEKEEVNGKEVNVYYILDGKQRLTNINGFVNGEYFLHEDTPPAVIEGKKYELAEMLFSELDEEVQDAIMDFSLQIYKMDEITDEQIEDLFYRLNNGTPLSRQQKAKAQMGTEWAKKIQSLVSHPVMTPAERGGKASFTPAQRKKADHETALLQTMMMIDRDYEWASISSNHVAEYAQTLRNNDSKDALVEKIKKALDYIDVAFEDKEAVLLRKVNFPMTIMAVIRAMQLEVHPMKFSEWRKEFKLALKDMGETTTKYKEFGGQGSVKRYKALGRTEEMIKHLEEYFTNHSKVASEDVQTELIEDAVGETTEEAVKE